MLINVGAQNKTTTIETNTTMDSNNNNKISSNKSIAQEKYGLRPRTLIKRLQQEKIRQEAPLQKSPRSKSRPAPLSKYRRKTANARERHRMREINTAFESLRKALPEAYEARVTNAMTKISTLKMAVQYIEALSRVLDDASDDFYSLETASLTGASLKQHYEGAVEAQKTGGPPSTQLHSSSTPLSHSSSSSSRGSLSSASDLEEFLSDDSALLDDNFDVFHDIQPLPGPDPFELLLDQGRENFLFSNDF